MEQWVGQRGLLVVGALALLAAAGFFLKYAFDHGWIPPIVRVVTTVTGGVALAIWGERQIRRGTGGGMRRYGAVMIGAGAGLVFLGIWAAAGPYALLGRRLGVLLLAGTTVATALLALRHELEELALWAILGAYLAPVVLPPPVPNELALLGYLEVIGLGLAVMAFLMSWRRAFDLALAGYLILALAGATGTIERPIGLWFLASGALLTLHVTHRRPWLESRLVYLVIGWISFALAFAYGTKWHDTMWLSLAAPVAVSGLLWWQHVRREPFPPLDGGHRLSVDGVLFSASPFVVILLVRAAAPDLLDRVPGLVPAALGAVHLGVGWVWKRASFFSLGIVLLATGAAAQWPAWATCLAWSALFLAAVTATRWAGPRPGARTTALVLAVITLLWLFSVALGERPETAPAFTDRWAATWYVYLLGTLACARWWQPSEGSDLVARGAEVSWTLCGVALLLGGSIELHRFFGSTLAGDLALSVYWLAYAGVLVWLGFRYNHKAVRSAGLAVAGGAGLKIVLYDLSNLEALYRIASFFTLALVMLAVAYVYNRKAKMADSPKASAE